MGHELQCVQKLSEKRKESVRWIHPLEVVSTLTWSPFHLLKEQLRVDIRISQLSTPRPKQVSHNAMCRVWLAGGLNSNCYCNMFSVGLGLLDLYTTTRHTNQSNQTGCQLSVAVNGFPHVQWPLEITHLKIRVWKEQREDKNHHSSSVACYSVWCL